MREGMREGREEGEVTSRKVVCVEGLSLLSVSFFVLLFFPFFFVLCSIGKVLSQRKSLAAVNRHTQQNSKHSSCLLASLSFPFPFLFIGASSLRDDACLNLDCS